MYQEKDEKIYRGKELIDKEDQICLHKNKINDSGFLLCETCGLEIKESVVYAKNWKNTRTDKQCVNKSASYDTNFFSEIESLGYNNEIIEKTIEIFYKVTSGKVYRGNMKNALIIASLYHILKNNSEIDDEKVLFNDISEKFSIDKKCIMKGLKITNLKLSKENNSKYITVKDLILSFLHKLNQKTCIICNSKKAEYSNKTLFSTHCQYCKSNIHIHTIESQYLKIYEIYEKIKNKNKIIIRSRHQSISSSLIYYYYLKEIEKNPDMIFNSKDFSNTISLSELTLNKLVKEFEKILNESEK